MHPILGRKKKIYIYIYVYIVTCKPKMIPCVHWPLLPKTAPSGHTQATDFEGCESITTHFWELLQGLLTVHGFWQDSDMHASCDGQSLSMRHSGVSVTIAKGKIKDFIKAGCKSEPNNVTNVIILTFSTKDKTISFKRWIASTPFLVVFCRTSCTRCTQIFLTKKHTLFSSSGWASRIVTYLIACTILVSCTFHLNTWNLRVALEPSWTITKGNMELYFTEGISSTDGVLAWIHTFFWNTSFVKWAVNILLALI